VLYKSGDLWVLLNSGQNFQVSKDTWNRVEFPTVKTAALRIEVQLQDHYSGGILGWKVN
jgi:hypothetical protein